MKKYILISMTLMASFAVGCQNGMVDNEFEQPSNPELQEGMTLQGALFEEFSSDEKKDGDSRVAFNENGMFFWTNGDAIGVENEYVDTGVSQMTLQSGAGTSSAVFHTSQKGVLGKYAVYPYSNRHTIQKDWLTVYVPETREYHSSVDKIDTDFFVGAEAERSSFSPFMYAEIKDGKAFFKHLGGVLCVRVEGLKPGRNDITFSCDEEVSGYQSVYLASKDSVPMLWQHKFMPDRSSTKSTVVFYNEGRNPQTSGVFYFPLAAGAYRNAALTVDYYGSEPAGNQQPELLGRRTKRLGYVKINPRDLRRVDLEQQAFRFTDEGATGNVGSRFVPWTEIDQLISFESNGNVFVRVYDQETNQMIDSGKADKNSFRWTHSANRGSNDKVYVLKFIDFDSRNSRKPEEELGTFTITQDYEAMLSYTIPGVSTWDYYTWLGNQVKLPIQTTPYKSFKKFVSYYKTMNYDSGLQVNDDYVLAIDSVPGDGTDVRTIAGYYIYDRYNELNNRVQGTVYFRSEAWIYKWEDPNVGNRPYFSLNAVYQSEKGSSCRRFVWNDMQPGATFSFKMHYAVNEREFNAEFSGDPFDIYSTESYVPTSEYKLVSDNPSLLEVKKSEDGFYDLVLKAVPKENQEVHLTYTCGTNEQVFTIAFSDDSLGGTGENGKWE